jgi:hypothetical protein
MGLSGVLGNLFGRRPAAPPLPAPLQSGELAPPEAPTDAAIEAWILQNLDISDWTYVGCAGGGATFASRVEPADAFPLAMRLEAFRTGPDADGRPCRSVVMTFDVDAKAGNFRLTRYDSFRLNNLKSPLERAHTPDPRRHKIAEEDGAFFAHMCRLQGVALGLPPEGPVSRLSTDVRAWTAQAIDPGDDVYAYSDDVAAVYVRAGSVRAGDKGFSMILRTEMYWPWQGFRSQTASIWLDEPRRRMRQLEARCFADHNLRGEVADVRFNRWIPVAGTFRGEDFDRLIEVARSQAG